MVKSFFVALLVVFLSGLVLSQTALAEETQFAPAVAPENCVMRDRLEAYFEAVDSSPDYEVRAIAERFRNRTTVPARNVAAALREVQAWQKVENNFADRPNSRPLQIIVVPAVNPVGGFPQDRIAGQATQFCGNVNSTAILMPVQYASLDRRLVGSTLAHEIAHAFQFGAARGTHAPNWYGEASAELTGMDAFTSQVTQDRHDAIFFNPAISLDRLDDADFHPYAAYRFVQWLRIRFGAATLRLIHHDVFGQRLRSNRQSTAALQYALGRNLPRVTDRRGGHRFSIADALGYFWIQHAKGEPVGNGPRVEGEPRTFGLGGTQTWDVSANRLAAFVGRIRLGSGVKTITYRNPTASADDLRLWAIDRGTYLNWTNGGRITYRSNGVGGAGALSNCPDGRQQRETKPWPGEFPFAFTNGEVDGSASTVRIEISTSADDERTEDDCPSENNAVVPAEARREVADSRRPRSGREEPVAVEEIQRTDPVLDENRARDGQRRRERVREERRLDDRPSATEQRELEREPTREREEPSISPQEREQLHEIISHDPRYQDRTGLPRWVWCVIGGAVTGIGAVAVGDVVVNAMAVPLEAWTAEQLRSWLAARAFETRSDGSLLDSLNRPVLDEYGQPVRLRTVISDVDETGRGPGGGSVGDRGTERTGIFDSHGDQLETVPEYRGGASSGRSYGVLPPASSPGRTLIVPFQDGVPQGAGVSLEDAGIHVVNNQLYVEDENGVWQRDSGRSRLQDVLRNAGRRSADRLIDGASDSLIRRMLEQLSDVDRDDLSSCNCESSQSGRVAAVASSPIFPAFSFARLGVARENSSSSCKPKCPLKLVFPYRLPEIDPTYNDVMNHPCYRCPADSRGLATPSDPAIGTTPADVQRSERLWHAVAPGLRRGYNNSFADLDAMYFRGMLYATCLYSALGSEGVGGAPFEPAKCYEQDRDGRCPSDPEYGQPVVRG